MARDYVSFGMQGLAELETLPTRLNNHFHTVLRITMADAADTIIEDAQADLTPGHGYDTGLLRDSLTKNLVDLAMGAGVFYVLNSDAADYWAAVEFGHVLPDGSFWPGYHFLSNAVEKNRANIFRAAYEAWVVTAGILSAESRAMVAARIVRF